MRSEHPKEIYKQSGVKWKSFSITIVTAILILMTYSGLLPVIEGAEMENVVSIHSSTDSLKLIYKDVDASKFPCIVSLVTVTNDIGFIVDKLDENNFEVREDNVRELPIEVVELFDPDIDVNVVLTIDQSNSMRGQPIRDAKAAASIFVELMQSKDQSAIVSFASQSRTTHPFSNDKNSLIAAISGINVMGGTAIFDALIYSAELTKSKLNNRVIILMTDGGDNSSQQTYEEALNALVSLKVRVFTIGLGLDRNSSAENVLKNLAGATGGMYYYSPSSSDLEEIYRAISMLLHHRYRISYTTHNPAKDGTLRHVRIDVIVRNNTNSDTASYRAPYEVDPVDPIDTVEPIESDDPVFEVLPNPFTPNDDGLNDRTEFRQRNGVPLNWGISIMDRYGRMIKWVNKEERYWDGKDETGQIMNPGCYLYIISNGDHVFHRGLIQLIR